MLRNEEKDHYIKESGKKATKGQLLGRVQLVNEVGMPCSSATAEAEGATMKTRHAFLWSHMTDIFSLLFAMLLLMCIVK
ncbi:unnamed protein product [Nippostrongylus brasiliensis]|uniref:Transmembrane protein n=1 Tax=Nippostrongylus brasiliensis TaxID=27835 RepID=A0A0N4XF28_NIPBR|nr:unnamed protein product [Nippostrongylus brasiliensis]